MLANGDLLRIMEFEFMIRDRKIKKILSGSKVWVNFNLKEILHLEKFTVANNLTIWSK